MNAPTRLHKRNPSIAALLLAAPVLLGACATTGQAATEADANGTVTVRYEGTANGVPLPELADDLGFLDGIELEWVGNTTSGPSSIQNTATGATDIGSAFTGAIIKLQDAGAPVTAVISSYGSDERSFFGYYVTEDSEITEPRDLIGKSVAVNTLGAHSEAVIGTYLRENGLTEEEIDQVQLVVLPPNDTEQALRTGQIDVGALSAALQDRAVAQGGLRRLFSDVDFFGEFNAGQYVLRDDFIAQNPEATRTLVTGIGRAIDWAREHTREEVVARQARIIQGRDRGESTDTLQYFKSYGVSEHGVISDSDLTLWERWLNDSGSIGGPIDPGDYYTNEYNNLTQQGK